jgi:hypothetical protein
MTKPALSKAELRAQLEAALASYRGPVTHCPPGSQPEPELEEPYLDDDDDDEVAEAMPVLELEV